MDEVLLSQFAHLHRASERHFGKLNMKVNIVIGKNLVVEAISASLGPFKRRENLVFRVDGDSLST